MVQKPGSSYSLVILNRNSTENFDTQVTKTFQLQHKDPYLIFKISPKILGIWFHNTNERVVMASLLKQVISNLQSAPASQPGLSEQLFSQQQQLPPQQQAWATTSVPLQPNGSRPSPAMASPQLQHTMQTPVSSQPRVNQGAAPDASPSQLIEPLINSLFVSPGGGNAAASNNSNGGAENTTQVQQQNRPPTSIPGVALDKKSLQLALLSLIQDERFIDLLHAQYLKVAHARASRNSKK